MRVSIKSSNFSCATAFVVIWCLISFVNAIIWREVEERIANDYKGRGIVGWSWELDPFCESTIINSEFPGSLWGVFTDIVSVVLPLADCNVVEIMVSTCIHRFTNEQGILGWNARSYMYSREDKEVYTFDLKRNKQHCNGAPVDIIDFKEKTPWQYKLIPSTLAPVDLTKMEDTVRNWRKAEERIANDYEGRDKVLWKLEMKSFCESTIINNKFPESLLSAYIVNVKVVLPSADCNVVQMETLTCVHRYTNEEGIFVWNEESYVGGLTDDKIYSFDLKRNKDECNGIPLRLIHYKEEIGSVNGLEPIKIYADYGQPPLVDPRLMMSDLLDYQALFSKFYYKGYHVPIEWKWDVEPFCKSRLHKGVPFSGANIKKEEIVLEWTNCDKVEFEILTCEYKKKLERGNQEIREFFANGFNHDLFEMGLMSTSSECAVRYPDSLNKYWVIEKLTYHGERKPITHRPIMTTVVKRQSLLKTIKNLVGKSAKGEQP